METLHQQNDIIAQRYRIVAPLGQGAFGTTYEAEDLTNYQRVAIKALSLSQLTDWKSLDLFEREARVLANLNHPAIPKYLDYFHEDTAEDHQFYLVQELVVGESLADLVKKGWHGNEAEIKKIAIQVLEILNYLHSLSPWVIHRDIKPQNIIRRSDGQVYLVDFGAVQDDYRQSLIRGGTFVGTLGYMPPEQFRGQVFFASDLYALGATLLFLLTHRSPADLPQCRMKIDFRSRVQISPEFADWLEKMLEPAAEDRFKSAIEALKALQNPRSRPNLSKQIPKKPTLSTGRQPRKQIPKKPTLSTGRQPRKQIPKKLTLSTGRQPKGSRIVLNKTSRHLVVKIPPIGWQAEDTITKIGCSLLFLGLPLIFNYTYALNSSSITSGQPLDIDLDPFLWPVPLPFLLLFGLIGLCLLWSTVYAFVGSSYLEIDSLSFCLGWKCLCFSGEVQGRTADIQCIEGSTIYEKERKHSFAAEVTPVEQVWLVAEISDFLKSVSSQKR